MHIATHGIVASSVGGATPFTNTLSTTFDGIDDYVNCGDLSVLSGAAEISVSLWFYATSTSNMLMLDLKDGTSRIAIQRRNQTKIYLYINGVSGLFPISTVNNTWYNLSYVFNGSGATNSDKLKLYINGIDVTATSYSSTVPTSLGVLTSSMSSVLGGLYNGTFTFKGNIDEVSLFNTELSASDVTSIYNSGTPNDISAMSGLVSWWRMGDGDTYPTITDNAGSNDGLMKNMSSANFVADVP